MAIRLICGMAGALLLASCAPAPPPASVRVDDQIISGLIDRDPVPMRFAACRGYGCQWQEMQALTGVEWRQVLDLFAMKATDPTGERIRIAQAIGLLEQFVGRRNGTEADHPRTPFRLADPSQLDCVDESVNSSTYLLLLQQAQLLHWHRVAEPARRGGFLRFDVHYTAVIAEIGSGDEYAVDSWFFANGTPPALVPLAVWRNGWGPDQAGQTLYSPQTSARRASLPQL